MPNTISKIIEIPLPSKLDLISPRIEKCQNQYSLQSSTSSTPHHSKVKKKKQTPNQSPSIPVDRLWRLKSVRQWRTCGECLLFTFLENPLEPSSSTATPFPPFHCIMVRRMQPQLATARFTFRARKSRSRYFVSQSSSFFRFPSHPVAASMQLFLLNIEGKEWMCYSRLTF